jgi:phage shock protein PspC (stress-responsive transcriptional regulator)
MNKVILVNLDGNIYQLEEDGYEALRRHLARAAARLQGNPDAVRTLADLDKTLAERCRNLLHADKTVVTTAEIDHIARELGLVDTGATLETPAAPTRAHQRRLYKLREDAMINGVCTGLAAYFDVDVTFMRLVFVLLTVATGGAWIIAYILLMFVMPTARTDEQRIAAHGDPSRAQRFVDRTKPGFADFRTNSSV